MNAIGVTQKGTETAIYLRIISKATLTMSDVDMLSDLGYETKVQPKKGIVTVNRSIKFPLSA